MANIWLRLLVSVVMGDGDCTSLVFSLSGLGSRENASLTKGVGKCFPLFYFSGQDSIEFVLFLLEAFGRIL